MVDYILLQKKIDESGLKDSYIAKAMSLTPQGFYNKKYGKNEFKHSEIMSLCELLNLTDKEKISIFFNRKVD